MPTLDATPLRPAQVEAIHGVEQSLREIDQAAIGSTMIPLPPIEIQRRQQAIIDNASDALALLHDELASAKRRPRSLRSSLLTAAFSGRLTGAAADLSAVEETITTQAATDASRSSSTAQWSSDRNAHTEASGK